MIESTRHEFAAQRKGVLEDAEKLLLPVVTKALEGWSADGTWWTSVLDATAPIFAEAYKDVAGAEPKGDRSAGLKEALGAALKHTEKPDKATAATVARLVAAAAVNAGTEAAAQDDEETLDLEWVTMHDSHVRESHRDADGQTRKIGEPFHIGESELDYPGDPKGKIEDWIGCRCVLRPTRPGAHSLVATAGNAQANTSTVIVALPAADDPVHGMGPEDSHCTLVWLGNAENVDPDQIAPHMAQVAAQHQPVTEGVSGRAELGKDKAQVLLLDADGLAKIRDALMGSSYIADTNTAADSHPTWIPHTTLGYPGQGDISEENPAQISFDRLALWHGDQQTEFPLGEQMDDDTMQDAPPSAIEPARTRIPFHGVMAVEGKPTGDKRSFKPGSLRNRDLPLQLTWQEVTTEGHDQAHFVATIEHLMRVPNEDGTNSILGAGHFRTTPQADQAVGAVADMGRHGVSIDADDSTYEYDDTEGSLEFTDARISGACMVNIPAFAEAYIQLGEAPWLTGLDDGQQMALDGVKNAEFARGPGWVTDPEDTRRIHSYWTTPGQPGYEKIAWGAPGDFDRCRAEVGKYLVAGGEPQFVNQTCAQWHHDALGEWPATHAKEIRHGLAADPVRLVASAGTAQGWLPPAEFFSNPHLGKPTRVTYEVTDKGTKVYGYIAEWGVCHSAFPGQCVTAPPSQLNYLDFLQSEIELDDGSTILVGVLTVGGGHAPDGLTTQAALEHYDNVATAVADVIVGEDEIGIWFCGAVRPWATERQRYELKAAKLSGDWREHGVGGPLEMIAAHAVNTPGFKTTAGTLAGRQVSLVAAGALEPEGESKLNIPELLAQGIQLYEREKEQAAAHQARLDNLIKETGADLDSRLARLQAQIGSE